MKNQILISLFFTGIFFSCSTTKVVVKPVATVPQVPIKEPEEIAAPTGLKRKVAIARFSNETLYGKGAFYTKANDPLAKKATDILSSKLAQSQKFLLLEKSDDFGKESTNQYGFDSEELIGVDYIIVGSISEFGRKDETDSKVFSRSGFSGLAWTHGQALALNIKTCAMTCWGYNFFVLQQHFLQIMEDV